MSRHFIMLNPGTKRTQVHRAGDCPDCFELLDGASSPEGHTPSPGDPTCCAYCGCLLVFGSDMELRRMTDDEFEAFAPEARATLMRYHTTFRTAANAMRDSRVKGLLLKIPKHGNPQTRRY